MAIGRDEKVNINRRGKLIAELRTIGTSVPDRDEKPAYGSTAWLLAELTKLPPLPGDLQAILRAHRDDQ